MTEFVRAAARPPDTHSCPGGCGRQVPHPHFACSPCWRRLPYNLQRPISINYGRDAAAHADAMADAYRWYRSHLGVRT